MRIINASETTVPTGEFEGMDLQEFAQEHTYAARELLRDSGFRREFTDHWYDLDFYLRALPRARRWMAGH